MDLSTKWLGLALKNPLVPSASPLSRSLDACRRLEDAGAAAIVMYSLFEEAVRSEEEAMVRFLHHQETGFGEADSFLPDHMDFPGELDRYLEQVAALKSSLGIPVIASLNGVTPGGWLQHAREVRDAGADALELNVYYVAADLEQPGTAVEARYLEVLHSLRTEIDLPINLKLSPQFSSVAHLVRTLEQHGAAGVSLFNRFYQPDIDVNSLRLLPALHPSTSADALLAMRWIAILHGRVGVSLGATGGIHTAEDAIKLLGLKLKVNDTAITDLTLRWDATRVAQALGVEPEPVEAETTVAAVTQAPAAPQKSYHPTPVGELGQHIGRIAKLGTRTGAQYRGQLEAFAEGMVRITIRKPGGTATLSLRSSDITSAQVLY